MIPACLKKSVSIAALALLAQSCAAPLLEPVPSVPLPDALQGFRTEEMSVPVAGGVMLNGLIIFPADEKKGTVLFFPDSSSALSAQIDRLLWLVVQGYVLAAVDYRGYGRSAGRPDLETVHKDAADILDYLIDYTDTIFDNLHLVGHGVGGSIAVHVAATHPYAGKLKSVVLEGAIASYRSHAAERGSRGLGGRPFAYIGSVFENEAYSPMTWAKSITGIPVLVVHDTEDKEVSITHGRKLYHELKTRKSFAAARGRGHGYATSDAEVRKTVLSWLQGKW